jgi:hypothetical protein
MHLAQAVEQAAEHPAQEGLGQPAPMLADMVAQGAAGFEAHHQIDGAVGAEKIQHADHVRMVQPGERPPFLEEQLQAVVEVGLEFGRNGRVDFPFTAQGQGVGQVFLDRHRRSFGVVRQIDDRKTAGRKLSLDAVAFKFAAGRQGLIVLGDHGRKWSVWKRVGPRPRGEDGVQGYILP